jgi:hypothetical protein
MMSAAATETRATMLFKTAGGELPEFLVFNRIVIVGVLHLQNIGQAIRSVLWRRFFDLMSKSRLLTEGREVSAIAVLSGNFILMPWR